MLAKQNHILLTIYWHLHAKATIVPCAAVRDIGSAAERG